MPDRVEVHDIACPASTPTTAPIEVAFNDDPATLIRVHIVIPDGHAGLTGIALGYGHQPILPRSTGDFISGNDEVLHFDISGYPDGVPWSAFVCNLDLQSHNWQIRLEYNEISVLEIKPPPALLSAQQIEQASQSLQLPSPPPVNEPVPLGGEPITTANAGP